MLRGVWAPYLPSQCRSSSGSSPLFDLSSLAGLKQRPPYVPTSSSDPAPRVPSRGAASVREELRSRTSNWGAPMCSLFTLSPFP